MFHRFLVAFDGSSHAKRALAEAVDLARTGNAHLTVMTVVPERDDWTKGVAPASLADITSLIDRSYQILLDAAVETVPHDLPVTKVLQRGAAGPTIVDEASAGGHKPDRHGLTRAR